MNITSRATPYSPPDNVRRLFQSAVTGNLRAANDLKSNAPLDLATITTQVKAALDPTASVAAVYEGATSTGFRVLYRITPSASGADKGWSLDLDLTHFIDAQHAQDAMLMDLSLYDADVTTITTRPATPLGQISLRTRGSVFWVHNALWVKLGLTGTMPGSPSTSGGSSSGSSSGTTATTPSTRTMIPELPSRMVAFATAIDKLLAANAVAASAQLKPNTAVVSPSYKGPWGQPFSFRLVSATGTHALKPAEVADGSVVIPTKNGTAQGEYAFIGAKVGTTTVKLVVARADTLAVGTAQVNVQIVAPGSS
ncbi:hypothetical protein B0T19DRAFT_480955 [Cercophora scortea]|uniref:Uncharacterized protein n=1 Tax=Cercophora scortea TaxID=314031 RepID=A0AAE0J570_9PEZI|nr:hypothetical protein B0T19DRAFT_480955 [Cercophora scortea]